MLRPLPGVRNSARLVQLYRTYPAGSPTDRTPFRTIATSASRPATSFGRGRLDLPGVQPLDRRSVAARDGTDRSANYFSVLGAQRTARTNVRRGRRRHSRRAPGGGRELSAWQGLFGGDPNILGRAVSLNGHQYTIVGVMPPEFKGASPLVPPTFGSRSCSSARSCRMGSSDSIAAARALQRHRAAPGRRQRRPPARARLESVVATLREQHRRTTRALESCWSPRPTPAFIPTMRTAQLGLSTVVMAVVIMLLLIACVNVANLFLARASDRTREMAVRLSLGATRSQLVKQLLTESLVFAVISGAAGLLIAWWAIDLANGVRLPISFSFDPDLRLSVPVLVFTLILSLITGVLFGLAPALQSTKPALVPALKGARCVGRAAVARQSDVVVAQMALSIVLLGERRAVPPQHPGGHNDRQGICERSSAAGGNRRGTARVQPSARRRDLLAAPGADSRAPEREGRRPRQHGPARPLGPAARRRDSGLHAVA